MEKNKEIKGRKCYDHLGGKLGTVLLENLLENNWIKLEENKTTVYIVTEKGKKEFKKMGIEL
jgi:predicted transcriptional regulator